ncbi:nucleolin [Orycteropus afer afer]|uniref:Nucleolin n=1 Tax=Orycteropus afer afer TaxID=1230840 RepID=A0AC54Z9E9_ORYAF|nr:nucleolin [Orycteropus afer afer]
MVKLAKAGKNQGDPKKMAPPPKEVEEDSEDEEMSEDEDDDEESSEEEVIIPQKKGKKNTTMPSKKVVVSPSKKVVVAAPAKKAAVTPGKKAAAIPAKKTVTPAKAVATPGKKGATPGKAMVATPGKKGVTTPAKGAKNGKNAKKDESDEEEDEDSEEEDEDEDEFEPAVMKASAAAPASEDEDEEDEEDEDEDDEDEDDDEDDSEEEAMETTPAKGKKAPAAKVVSVKAKSVAEEEDDDEEEDEDDDEDDDDEEEEEDEDEEEDDEEEEEEEEEEEPVKEVPGKRKKEMAKQKAAPEAKKQKVEAVEPTSAFNLFVGNLNCNKSAPELKSGLSELFAKNDLTVTDVRIGMTRKFGYVDFESAEDLEKALELTGLKVFGNEIKLERPKGKDSKKDRDARTLLAKNLPYKVTQDELKEVFEDAMEIRLVSKDGKSKGIAYLEFKTEADADKTFEEKQGTEIDGRSISLYYTGEKGQSQDHRGGKTSTWSGESKTLVLSNLSYNATEETLQEVFEKATAIKVPQNQNGKSKGYAFIEFASFEDAKEALNSCNKKEIEGRAIRLELQGSRGSPNARSQPSKTLFVKGLSEDTTEETLKESFDGSVRARIVTDRETGSSKGFGFVDFNSEEDAKAAKEAMEDGEIDGNKVTLDWAKPKGEGGFGGRGGGRGGFGGRGGHGRGGRGGFGGRGRGGFGGRGGFRGGRGGGGDHKPQGKKTKFE